MRVQESAEYMDDGEKRGNYHYDPWNVEDRLIIGQLGAPAFGCVNLLRFFCPSYQLQYS